MGKKDLSLIVECEECHEKFSITSETSGVTYKREFRVDGQSIYLTYYDCPKCGKRHFVQIDDEKSLELLKINEGQFVHNAALKARGQKLRKKKIDRYKDTQKHLANYRRELMKKFTGKELYDEERNSSFELRFSI